MAINYSVVVKDVSGIATGVIVPFESLIYARKVNEVGTLLLELEPEKYDVSMFPIDARLEVWRGTGGVPALDMQTCWFVRSRTIRTDTDGVQYLGIGAVDAMDLLARRIVAYQSTTAQAKKTDQIDDMMKAIVRENLGASATDTARRVDTWLNVDADEALASSESKEFSRDNVLTVLQNLASVSKSATTANTLIFDVVYDPNATAPFTFRTFTQQRGVDHRWPSSSQPVLLSVEAGNLGDALLEEDYLSEINYVYAGGTGTGKARKLATASDAESIAASPFGRREGWVDAPQAKTTAALQSEANKGLTEGKAKRTFTGRLVDCEGTRYGVHYGYGDYVTAELRYGPGRIRRELFDLRVNSVRVTVTGEMEQIDVQLTTE